MERALLGPPGTQVMVAPPKSSALRALGNTSADAQRSSDAAPPGVQPLDEAAMRHALEEALPARLRRGFVYESSADGVDENLMLFFHGHGCVPRRPGVLSGCGHQEAPDVTAATTRDCAANFASFARKLQLPQTALLVLNGPVPFPSAEMPSGRTWFGDDEDTESELLGQCVSELTTVVKVLVEHGWRHRQLHVCGFSDGGQVRGFQRCVPRRLPCPDCCCSCAHTCADVCHFNVNACKTASRGRYIAQNASVRRPQRYAIADEPLSGGTTDTRATRDSLTLPCHVRQVALELALRHSGPQVLGSCVAMSAALTVHAHAGAEPRAAPHTPVLMTRGTCDDVISEEDVAHTVAVLRRAWPSCGPHVLVLPGRPHAMPRSSGDVRGIFEFWSHTLRRRPPGRDVVELT